MIDEADPEDVEQAVEAVETDFEWVCTEQKDHFDTGVIHTIIENEDGPSELGLFPRDGEEDLFEWITATGEESFVDLWDMR